MKIYNTLTRQKEEFKPIVENTASIYACGPTVYNYIHIGNARPACVFDTLRRYLEWKGMKVNFVQNFTDVDDKIIKKSLEEGITALEVANRYIKEYKTDAQGLNIREATYHPRVTESMDIIMNIIETLIEKGHAYELNGDVYFKTKSFKEYGKLSHMPLEELESGARIDVNEEKNDPMDFALWKKAKEGEPFWESPWGKGRPGWHIECSAMSRRFLGDTIDIHCGGQDLIFPHHENEIAQSECATGHHYAHYWMHNGYLNIDNKKMSKSAGNFFTVRDVAAKYGYEPIRYLMISAHYRSPINYSEDIIKQCVASLDRLYSCRDNMEFRKGTVEKRSLSAEWKAVVDSKFLKFNTSMDDDLNTADAVSALFELTKEINTSLAENRLSYEDVEYASLEFEREAYILGILYARKNDDGENAELKELLEARAEARKNKDFAAADAIRAKIEELGYIVKDTREGPQLIKK